MTNVIWCQDIQTHVSGSLESYCVTKACLGYLIHKCILYRCGFGSVSNVLAVKTQGLKIRSLIPHISWAQWHPSLIPGLGIPIEADTWNLLINQSIQINELQVQ